MAELKTKRTNKSVTAFLNTIPDPRKRAMPSLSPL